MAGGTAAHCTLVSCAAGRARRRATAHDGEHFISHPSDPSRSYALSGRECQVTYERPRHWHCLLRRARPHPFPRGRAVRLLLTPLGIMAPIRSQSRRDRATAARPALRRTSMIVMIASAGISSQLEPLVDFVNLHREGRPVRAGRSSTPHRPAPSRSRDRPRRDAGLVSPQRPDLPRLAISLVFVFSSDAVTLVVIPPVTYGAIAPEALALGERFRGRHARGARSRAASVSRGRGRRRVRASRCSTRRKRATSAAAADLPASSTSRAGGPVATGSRRHYKRKMSR